MPFGFAHVGGMTTKAGATVRRHIVTLAVSFGIAACFGAAVSVAAPQTESTKENSATTSVPASTVSLTVDGTTNAVETHAATVREFLLEQKVILGKLDRTSVPLSTPITADMAPVQITRVRVETVKQKVTIAFDTKKQFTPRLKFGETKVVRPGANGERVKTFRVTYKDDVEVARVKTGDTAKEPKTAYVLAGTRGMTFSNALASRGYFGGRRILEMRATGYGPGDNGQWGARTATGLKPGYGVVAVDPNFIPLGTRLYIEGYGYAVAGDTGGAIKGNRIDLGCDSRSDAQAVGRRKVRVMILN